MLAERRFKVMSIELKKTTSFPLHQTVSRRDNHLFQKSKLSKGNSKLLTD